MKLLVDCADSTQRPLPPLPPPPSPPNIYRYGPHLDDGVAAGELGDALAQLLAVVHAVRLAQLLFDLWPPRGAPIKASPEAIGQSHYICRPSDYCRCPQRGESTPAVWSGSQTGRAVRQIGQSDSPGSPEASRT